jgi:predicted esterase
VHHIAWWDRDDHHEAWREHMRESDGALVLLHARGTDDFDLVPLLDELDPARRLVGVTARAPLELSPDRFHWYVSRAVGYPDHDTFHQTYRLLIRWLDALPDALGVPWSRTDFAYSSLEGGPCLRQPEFKAHSGER